MWAMGRVRVTEKDRHINETAASWSENWFGEEFWQSAQG